MPRARKVWSASSRLHAAYMIAVLSSDSSYRKLAESTGISLATLHGWRYRLPDSVWRFEKVLNAVGYELTITQKGVAK